MSTTYELQEKLKELENEIRNLLEEQNHYLRIILNKRKQEELSNTEELESLNVVTYSNPFSISLVASSMFLAVFE
jgi:hypothetical protein